MIHRLFYTLATAALLQVCTLAVLADSRLPVPAEAELNAALKVVREVYGKAYATAKTPADKEALVQKVLETAQDSTDTTNRFAALRVARDIAIQAGSVEAAFTAIDQLAKEYEIDAGAMKLEAITQAASRASIAEHRLAIVKRARALQEAYVLDDDFDVARRLGEIAAEAARRARDSRLVNQVTARNKDIEQMASEFDSVSGVLATLETPPTDPEANLAVGRYRCLVKGDWENGLPLLALGSDAALKELAIKEMEGVSDASGQEAVGDGWWELAESEEGARRKQLLARAGYWYTLASAKLAGLSKRKVDTRLSQIREIAIPAMTMALTSQKTFNIPWRPTRVCFSPSSKTVAVGYGNGNLQLRDVEAGRVLWSLQAHRDNVITFVGFSPDGRRLTTASYDKSVRCWGASNGTRLGEVKGHETTVRAAPFAPDGKTFATASDDKTVKVWDSRTGKRLVTLTGHTDRVMDVQYSHDGNVLATSSWDSTIRLWNLSTGKERLSLKLQKGHAGPIAFSPNDLLLASVSEDGILRVWDVASGREMHAISGHSSLPTSITFHPHASILATSDREGQIILWDALNGHKLQTLRAHGGCVGWVTFSPDGRLLASCGHDNTVKLWEVHLGTK